MDAAAIRNFRDFLLLYNRISESCFQHCASDLSRPEMTELEAGCVERCAHKHVKMNNRAMQVYVEVQPTMTQKRIDEMNKQAEEIKARQEAQQKTESVPDQPEGLVSTSSLNEVSASA